MREFLTWKRVEASPRLPYLVAALAALAGIALWWHAAGPGAQAGSDFNAYYAGAQAVAQGQNPYHRLLVEAPDTANNLHANGYVYPPLLAVVLALDLRLGMNAAMLWLVWTALNAAALVAMAYQMQYLLATSPMSRATAWARALVLAALMLLPAVVIYDLWLGQADLLVTALVVIACALWARRNPWAGLLLGCAIAIKPTMGVIILLWLWKRDWNMVARVALATAALYVIPFLLVGPAALQDYVTFLLHWNGVRASAEFINQAPYGMLLRAFTANGFTQPLINAPWLVGPLRIAITLGALALWARAVTPRLTGNRALLFSEVLLTLPLAVLLSPLAEDIHYCVIIPTLVGLSYAIYTFDLWRSRWSWVQIGLLVIACIPRMQELIYPNYLLIFPGQTDPRVGWLIVLARSGTLLWLGTLTFVAGIQIVRLVRLRLEQTVIQPNSVDEQAAIIETGNEDILLPHV